jgi:four helix bundle protein
MLNLNHKKLDVWVKSKTLVVCCRKISNLFPKYEQYNLTSQLNRAALSVSNNIAEGAARRSTAERRRFFEIARSSVVEVDNCIEIAFELKYANPNNIGELETLAEDIFKMLTGLINKT